MKLERQTKKLLIIEAIVALVVIVAVAIGVSVYYKTQEKPPYATEIIVIDDWTGRKVSDTSEVYGRYEYDGRVHTFTPILRRLEGDQEEINLPIHCSILWDYEDQRVSVDEIKKPGFYMIMYSFNQYGEYEKYQYAAFTVCIVITE